jgi:hypothetical protein
MFVEKNGKIASIVTTYTKQASHILGGMPVSNFHYYSKLLIIFVSSLNL